VYQRLGRYREAVQLPWARSPRLNCGSGTRTGRMDLRSGTTMSHWLALLRLFWVR
jgi:hypothetical protein